MTAIFVRSMRSGIASVIGCVALLGMSANVVAQPAGPRVASPIDGTQNRGVPLNSPNATPGYTLFTPMNGTTTYLIDTQGGVVKTWDSEFAPSGWVHLTEDGELVRGGLEPQTSGFRGGGQGGRFQKFSVDGELIWDYSLNTAFRLPHHDATILPNGNILAAVWEMKSRDDTLTAGRHESFVPPNGVWDDGLVELVPDGLNGAQVVWEWRVWDHLVQNSDPTLPNHGAPADHPERIDVNGDHVGIAVSTGAPPVDVFHINSVDYNPQLDQILLNSPTFNEIWVIDHGTSTAEARGSSGGRYGRGGDLLYRWGNPIAYGRGSADERQLGFQHDARWIPRGFPGGGNMTIFSNRSPGRGVGITKVLEILTPINEDGSYSITGIQPFGPASPAWEYSDPGVFSATYLSGAQRLANGHTLITSGPQGRLFEVDAGGNIVWEYWSPFPESRTVGGANMNPFAIFKAVRLPLDHPGVLLLLDRLDADDE